MPQLRVGETLVTNLRVGNIQGQRAYIGTTLVWLPGQEWVGSPASVVIAGVWSTWGPALVPSGKAVHWDAAYESDIVYQPGTDRVSIWKDRSGNNWDLREPIVGAYQQLPTRKIGYNGLPVLHFEADDFMVHWIDSGTPDNIDLPQPITVHIVAAAVPYSGYPLGLTGGQGALAGAFQVTVTDADTLMFAAGTGVFYDLWNSDRHLITAIYNGGSSIQRLDGVQIGTGNPGTANLLRLQIGITHQILDVVACEYVFYNRALNSTEIAYNEDILRAKWFLAAGVWKGSPATVTLYASARTWYRGAAPAFRPDVIESCFGWWDANDETTFTFSSGVNVQQWRDKTSAARHLGVVASSTEPDRDGTMNGLTTVTFDGSEWMLILPEPGAGPATQPVTYFVVATTQTHTDWTNVMSGTLGCTIFRRPNEDEVEFSAGVGFGPVTDANPHLFVGVFDRGKSQQRVDGTQIGKVNTGPMDCGPLRIGTGGFAGHGLRGSIAEVVVYERNLESTEIAEVEAYLLGKWFGPPPPQTWNGSTPTVTITATSGIWYFPGLWSGSTSSLTITATSGTWSALTTYGDDFNRANSLPINSGGGAIGLGSGWKGSPDLGRPAGTFYINTNKAVKTSGDHWTVFLTDMGSTDHFVEAVVTPTNSSNYPVLFARMQGTSDSSHDNCYQGYISGDGGNQAHTSRWVGGSWSLLNSGSFTNTGTHKLRLECQGNQIRTLVDDVLIATSTNTEITTGTYVGMGGASNGDGTAKWEDFRCGPL